MESKVTIKAALAFKKPFRSADITFWVVLMGIHQEPAIPGFSVSITIPIPN